MNKQTLSGLTITIGYILSGCGGGSSTNGSASNNTPPPDNGNSGSYLSQQTVVDTTAKMASQLNATGLLSQAKTVDETNYVDFHSRISTMKAFGIPNLKNSFKLAELVNRSAPLLNKNAIAQRRVDKSYDCLVSGSATEVIDLTPRGTLHADAFKTGDDYKITYHNCNMGDTTYNGSKTYHVDEFSEFDFSQVGAGDPMGKFTTRYSQYSIETSTQKVTMNGTFVYSGKASYPAIRDAAPTSLTKTYAAKLGSSITILDKQINKETILSYTGILKELSYTKLLLTETHYTYCKKSDYHIKISESGQSTNIPIYSKFCGDVKPGDTDTLYPPRSLGQPDDIGSSLKVNGRRIITFVLADGRTRYIYQADASNIPAQNPDAITETEQVIYDLPATDGVDLMNGVVVFAFEGCPGYEGLFKYLNENNIPHTYIDIRNTTAANLAAFNWFGANFVPYVGANGHYFPGPFTKNMLAIEGIDIIE